MPNLSHKKAHKAQQKNKDRLRVGPDGPGEYPLAQTLQYEAFVPFVASSEAGFKSGKTRSFLTRSTVRGEALKERSEGSWRSGRRRSGDAGGGGTGNVSVFRVVPL